MLALARTLVQRLRPYRRATAILLALLVVQVAFENGFPLSLKYLIDDAIVPRDDGRLMVIVVVVAVAAVLFGLSGVFADRLYSTISSRVLNDLRRDMFGQLQRLPLTSFYRLRGGDLASRFSADLAALETALTVSLPSALLSTTILLVSFALLLSLQWQLALLVALGLPIAAVFPRLLGSRAAAAAVATRAQQSRIGGALQESINGRLLIRAFGLRRRVGAQFEDRLAELHGLSSRASFLAYLMERMPNLAVIGVQIVVLGVGAAMAIDGAITVGTLVAFNGLLLTLSQAVYGITYALPGLVGATAAHHRVQDVLTEPPEIGDERDCVPMPPLEREIQLRDVTFAHEPGSPVLDGVSLTIPRGSFVAVVGGSGSGKTTLLNLLLRLHEPTAGAILVDGRDTRELRLDSLRARISLVPQEPFLFDLGVADNVLLARPDATDEDVREACRLAGIADLVRELPHGYATKAGERGGRFSVGQRQRIAVARAILRRPDLLLLDEPTAALDVDTEAQVNTSLWLIAERFTTVYATHRVSTVAHADHIVVLDGGRAVEQGTHAQLLAAEGRYRALWDKQSGFVVGAVAAVEARRLRDVPVLGLLGDEALQEVAGMLATVRLPAGAVVFSEGDRAEAFHLIARGRVEVFQGATGEPSRIATLDDGDHFGEIALVRDVPRTATVKTLTPTTFLVLRRTAFAELLGRHPGLRDRIEATVDERLARDARRSGAAAL